MTFLFINENSLANDADDNTPYTMNKDIDDVLNTLVNDTNILKDWFRNNYFLLNNDKCNLLITNHDEDISLKLGNEIITGKKWVKLLDIKVDNKLDFSEHASSICRKANLKLHVLARVSKFMNKEKLRILARAFRESQFGYCPLIWMFHNMTLNNKINRLHERTLRLVYNGHDSSFGELLLLDNSLTIHERNIEKLATEMYKVANNITPSFVKSIFPLSTNPYHLRNKQTYEVENIQTSKYGSETPTCVRKHGPWFQKVSKTQYPCKYSKQKYRNGNLRGARAGSVNHILPTLVLFSCKYVRTPVLNYIFIIIRYINLFTF